MQETKQIVTNSKVKDSGGKIIFDEPVLPIVYYEGSDKWTVPLDFKSRIHHGDVFAKYIPDFQYYLVPICGYTNEELLKNADEISVVMLINKLQTWADVKAFRELPSKQLETILRDTPPHLLNIIVSILMACLLKMNVPVEEAVVLCQDLVQIKMRDSVC